MDTAKCSRLVIQYLDILQHLANSLIRRGVGGYLQQRLTLKIHIYKHFIVWNDSVHRVCKFSDLVLRILR